MGHVALNAALGGKQCGLFIYKVFDGHPQAKVESPTYYIRFFVIKKPCSLNIFDDYKLFTRAYGTDSKLASQGRGLRPKLNIGPNN